MSNWMLKGKGGIMNECEFTLGGQNNNFISNICIGTDPNNCSIIYPVSTPEISPLHCQLTYKNNTWYITDFSDSGTFLNGNQIEKNKIYPLNNGDVFSVGNFKNNFEIVFLSDEVKESDISKENLREKFFSYQGRLNRKPFILRGLALGLASFVVAFVIVFICILIGISEDTAVIIAYLICVPFWISGVMLSIKRWHDTNHSGWWHLLSLVPIVNFYAIYMLFFKKGTAGINRFGQDPMIQN